MIDVQVAWNRPVRSLAGVEPRILLVRLVPQVAVSGEPCHLCLLLDTSGSMEGEKLTAAKSACGLVWERLRDEDSFGIIQFSSDAGIIIPVTVKRMLPRDDLDRGLAGISAGGVTLMDRALTLGRQVVRGAQPNRPRFLAIVTDGNPTNGLGTPLPDLAALLNMADQLAKDGVTLLAVGLGNAEHYNAGFLTDLSDRGHGQFCYSPEPQGLANILDQRLQAAQKTAAGNATLSFQLRDGKINWVARILPEYAPMDLPNRTPAKISAVSVGAISRPETAFLLEIETEGLFGAAVGDRLVGTLSVSAVVNGQQKVFGPVDIRLRFDLSLLAQQRVNQEVENLRVLAEINRNQDRIRRGVTPDEALALAERNSDLARQTGDLAQVALYEAQAKALREEGAVSPDLSATLTARGRETGNLFDAMRSRSAGKGDSQ